MWSSGQYGNVDRWTSRGWIRRSWNVEVSWSSCQGSVDGVLTIARRTSSEERLSRPNDDLVTLGSLEL